MSFKQRLATFADAVDERIAYRSFLAAAADEPVPGGARFAYVFGSALLFTFTIQVLTGIALASTYSPSVTDAWGSVWYIQNQMTMGWFVRGLHHFGSSAMIVLCVLHMTQVFLYGAYKRPREANWLTGMVMLLLVLGFGLTGYLLPWDQKGYWATQVATSIMGGTPGGPALQEVLQGGVGYGNQTLTRFYAIHVFILPITMVLFLVGHVGLFRKHGVKTSPRRSSEDVAKRTDKFWPYQVLYDLIFAVVVLASLVALVVTVGVGLDAPADPSSAYEARPEWYFLFLFQLLKYFEGPMTLIGTVVIPGLAFGFLFAVPFIDKKGTRPGKRVLIPFILLFAGAGGLTAVAFISDANSESYHEGRKVADEDAKRANDMAALGGVDGDGRVVLHSGYALFVDKGCSSCHTKLGKDGEAVETPGPLLAGYGTVARIDAFLTDPNAHAFFGATVLNDEMDPFDGSPTDRVALATWLAAQSGKSDGLDPTALARGRDVFVEAECTACHNDPTWAPTHEEYDAEAQGPDLKGYQSFEWTRSLLRDANAPAFFGDAIEADDRESMMPAFPDLTDGELRLLTRWLMAGAPDAD